MSDANNMGVQIFYGSIFNSFGWGGERLISGMDTDFIVNPMRIFYSIFYRGLSSDTSSRNAEDFSFFTFLIFIVF